jgi:hypothetical protein
MSDTTGPGGATHVGIDVSKERLDVCFIPEGEHFVVANNEAGIQSLLDRLLEACRPRSKRSLRAPRGGCHSFCRDRRCGRKPPPGQRLRQSHR